MLGEDVPKRGEAEIPGVPIVRDWVSADVVTVRDWVLADVVTDC